VQLLEQIKQGYNGDQYLFHIIDQDTKWHEGCCIPDKTKATLTRVFERLLAKIKRQFESQVIIVRLDMKTGYVELLEICRYLGIVIELLNEAPKIRIHPDQLSAEPKRWKDLVHYSSHAEFGKANRKEIDRLIQRSCFGRAARASELIDAEILTLMWVFTYKFDEDRYLYKFKARLVVRGDLEQDYGDTNAATLAAPGKMST
jgi:hypothetical protein